ncbi:MAG: MTH938/NDUFAF3 family protein [Phycisphaerae bacterium]|jgi:hypothetical protein|nr:MTH938/NDUFAF3 family protein [Phycisphaerae bacterium]
MHIDSYEFGQIVVDGTAYAHDVIVFRGRACEKWRRQSDHGLRTKDVADVLARQPSVFVIGTGNSGKMRVRKSVLEAIEDTGIRVFADRTPEAVRIYNEFVKGGHDVVGAFHVSD